MSSIESDVAALRSWLQEHGGLLHPSINIVSDQANGIHLSATAEIPASTTLVSVPHEISLSCLNAMVDDAHPVFRDNAEAFSVESLGFFYLVSQYINIADSFWSPYLKLLPKPETLNIPFWFDDQDVKWLQGTDVYHSYPEREKVWKKYWEDGIKVIDNAGVDSKPYTWELYKWAATMFSSRSFGSRALRPQSSSRWQTFRHYGRQPITVVIPDQRPERQSFPVLFPVMDSMNHSPIAKVDWNFAPGKFTLDSCEKSQAGQQIFNNYGPKSNTELLMGYGFCIADNPYDCVIQTLRPPPPELVPMLKTFHPDHFDRNGEWLAETSTYQLYAPSGRDLDDPLRCWTTMPAALLQQFYYRIRCERGLSVDEPLRDPSHHLLNREGTRYLPHMAFLIVMFLTPKIKKLVHANKELAGPTQNAKQEMARVYREGQLRIMRAVRESHLQFLRSLRLPEDLQDNNLNRPLLLTLAEILDACKIGSPELFDTFVAGIRTVFTAIEDGPDLLKNLDGNDEHDILVLWICYAYLDFRPWMGTLSSHTDQPNPPLVKYIRNLEREYGSPVPDEQALSRRPSVDSFSPSPIHPTASRWLSIVQHAALAVPGSLWSSKAWTSDFVLDWGFRIVEKQGMSFKLNGTAPQVYLYLHTDEDDFPV